MPIARPAKRLTPYASLKLQFSLTTSPKMAAIARDGTLWTLSSAEWFASAVGFSGDREGKKTLREGTA